ncbi:hypothetical protein C5S53_11205 [Methanophagales archaeon]|nr:hypothetical protein C5S53_11205 [Methanophagales archaeon]
MCAPLGIAVAGGVVGIQAILATKVLGVAILGSIFVLNYFRPLKRLSLKKVSE